MNSINNKNYYHFRYDTKDRRLNAKLKWRNL